MLKQQHEDLTVSSTMLWQQVLKDLQATRPWQRLKTRLLLILQILAILLFTLSLVRPVHLGGGTHYIAVVDASARMQATDLRPSRMDNAKESLKNLIQSMTSKDSMTIIRAGMQPFVAASQTGDKSVLREYTEGITASNGKSDIEQAIQMAQTIKLDSGIGEIHLFSGDIADGSERYINHTFSNNGQNVAVTDVSYSIQDTDITILSQITNYGDDKTVNLELEVDGIINNIKEVFIPAGERVSVYWTDIQVPAAIIKVSIVEDDDLLVDNQGFAVVSEAYNIKTLLVTERNVFIERAISLRKDIELIKTNPGQELESENFLFYIFDGSLPETLPLSGHLMIFNPPSNDELGISIQSEITPSGVRINEQTVYPELVQYIELEDYHIAKANRIEVPDGFDVLLEDKDSNPLLLVGEKEGRKVVIFTFLLHDSNIPLKVGFPILIQNLLTWMLPPTVDNSAATFAGESLPLSPLPDVSTIMVTSPSGREYNFDAYPTPIFYDTHEVGVYEVAQKASDSVYKGRFSVSVPTMEVSNLRSTTQIKQTNADQSIPRARSPFTREIWMFAGWVLMVLLLIEWWVYHHGI